MSNDEVEYPSNTNKEKIKFEFAQNCLKNQEELHKYAIKAWNDLANQSLTDIDTVRKSKHSNYFLHKVILIISRKKQNFQ